MSTLQQPQVKQTLEQLHQRALNDHKTNEPGNNATRFMAVNPDEGHFLNFVAGLTRARHIVEFGCSFGISTIYLAAAAKDNGGQVTTTELEPAKAVAARQHFEQAGLSDIITIREGDALQTLADVGPGIDLLFLDGAKPLYLPVFHLLQAKLSPGAVMVADNADKPETQPFVQHILQAPHAFNAVWLFEGRALVAYLL